MLLEERLELYRLLGCTPSVSIIEAKKIFRKRVRETHPDLGGNPDEFIRVKTLWDKAQGYGLENVFGQEEVKKLSHKTLFSFRWI